MGLLRLCVNLAIDFSCGLSANKSALNAHQNELTKLLSGEPLSVEEFERLYDMRIYNWSSKQSDKKYLKANDEPGVYVLANITKDKSFVGKGNKVFQKAFKQINGHGNARIYHDLAAGDIFEIYIYTLSKSSFDNLDDLFKDALKVFGRYD